MLEFLLKAGKKTGNSLDQMKDLWKKAKRFASQKGLVQGGQAHTQRSLQRLKELAEQNSAPQPAEKLADKIKKSKK